MKTFTSDELKKVIDDHKLWLTDSSKGCKANLRHANFSNANLFNANLTSADLSFTDFSNANLFNANLTSADLFNANLTSADLSKANLFNADLSKADLTGIKGLKKAMEVKVNDIKQSVCDDNKKANNNIDKELVDLLKSQHKLIIEQTLYKYRMTKNKLYTNILTYTC